MLKKLINLHRGQKGITGLETAIILIAFVVVAAVFAYTVLSAGLFSTQKSQEAVYAGLNEAQSTLEPRGSVVAYKAVSLDNSIGKIEFTIATSGDKAIDLTPSYTFNGTDLADSGLDYVLQVAYNDLNVAIADCPWTVSFVGYHSDDYMLEPNEKAVITVWLHNYATGAWADGAAGTFLNTNRVDTNHNFTLEVKPPAGAVLTLERTTPAYLDTVVDLH